MITSWNFTSKAFIVVSLIVLLNCSACSPGEQQPSPQIRIGVLVDPNQQWMGSWAQLAAKLHNDSGGCLLNGTRVPVSLSIEPLKSSDQEDAVSSTLKLINQDSVIAIIGPYYSKQCIPAGLIAEKARIPLLTIASSHPEVTRGKQFVFRLTFNNTQMARALADFTRKELRLKRVGILYEISDDYSRDLAEQFQAAFREFQGEIVAMESFTPDTRQSFRSQLQQIRQRQAEGVFLPNYAEDVNAQLEELHQSGIPLQPIAGDVISVRNIRREFSAVYYAGTPPIDSTQFHQMLALVREFFPHNSTQDVPTTADALNIILEAVRLSGSVNTEIIRQTVCSLNAFKGIQRTYSFSNSNEVRTDIAVYKVDHGLGTLMKVYH